VNDQFLLDTHILIWLNSGDRRITNTTLARLRDADSVMYSAASAWEIAIKQSAGKLQPTQPLSVYARKARIGEIPVTTRHAEIAGKLPLHHRDPFDRMLVAQAMVENLTLVTADRRLKDYDVPIWVIE
jgi:PIN domain nuclease of toxin-antitoxin system